jgi:hypothetical protein
MAIDDSDLLDCFVNLPFSQGVPFVPSYNIIRDAQVGDARLTALRDKKPDSIINQQLAPDISLACYIPAPDQPWKIYLPSSLLDDTILWYHLVLGHIGMCRKYILLTRICLWNSGR